MTARPVSILVKGHNFVNESEEPHDNNGHGTEMAGVIEGVAPGVKIMPVKILDYNATGDINTEIKGIVWAVNNGANIINLSLGGGKFNVIEYLAVKYAINKGVVIIAAVGNDNTNVSYPAAYDDVIAVSSVNMDQQISIFADNGPQVTVAAPGEMLFTTALGNKYKYTNGTSSAGAFVSGVVALLLAKDDSLTPNEIKQLIKESSDKMSQNKVSQYDYGIINPVRLYKLADNYKKNKHNNEQQFENSSL